MHAIRWALLVPVAVAAWYAVFAAGLFTHSYVEHHFCPPEDLWSGFCSNSTIQTILAALMHLFVAVSAVAVGVSAVLVAPSHKQHVVWVTLAVGSLVAAYFGFMTRDWWLFTSASFGGTVGATVIVSFLRRMPNDPMHTCEDARA